MTDPDIVPLPTVLLIEDEQIVAVMTTAMLEQLNYAVIHCATAEDAVKTFTDKHSDIALVILDLVLPDGKGADVYEDLKIVDPGLACLVASGYALDETELKPLRDAGINGYIKKPFKMAELNEALQGVLA